AAARLEEEAARLLDVPADSACHRGAMEGPAGLWPQVPLSLWRGGPLGRLAGQGRLLVEYAPEPGVAWGAGNASRYGGARPGDGRAKAGEGGAPRRGARQARDLAAPPDQLCDQWLADGPARPGDEDPHGSLLTGRGRDLFRVAGMQDHRQHPGLGIGAR